MATKYNFRPPKLRPDSDYRLETMLMEVSRRTNERVAIAQRRINKYTPMEWVEVDQGLRDRPLTATLKKLSEALQPLTKLFNELCSQADKIADSLSKTWDKAND